MRNGPKADATATDAPDLRISSSLTEIERKILDYMVLYLRTNTYQPSIREIGEQFGIKSTKTVSEHLQALADKGFLERDPSRSRGVRILGMDLNAQTVSVPCYQDLPDLDSGFKTDGADLYVSMDRRFAGGKGCFMVQTSGDALAEVGVGDGDYLVVEPTPASGLRDGELIVARLGGNPEYFRVEKKSAVQIVLHPVGTKGSPLAVDEPATLGLVGRVAALYRRIGQDSTDVQPTAH